MSGNRETGWWSEQDLNFQPRFSSARRQLIVTFRVFEAIVASGTRTYVQKIGEATLKNRYSDRSPTQLSDTLPVPE